MSESSNQVASIIQTSAIDKRKTWLYAEIAGILLLIIGVWILLFLPIIVYHLSTSEITSNGSDSTNATDGDTLCSTPLQYATTSGICLVEFANMLRSSNCSPGPEGYPLVMNNNEVKATQLINGLTTLGASAECLHKAIPLLCLHLFGLCSASGLSIQPTSSQCEEIRDTACKQQWKFVETLDIGLPNCKMLPAESTSCPALNDSLSTNGAVITNMLELEQMHSNETKAAHLECTGDFYQENGSSYCTRSCNTWVQLHQGGVSLFLDLFTILLSSLSTLVNATVIILSCLARKRMHIFPAIFVVYMTIDILVINSFIMVGFMDRGKLFCASRSLIKSLTEVTPFCVIFGIAGVYLVGQLNLWWLLYTATLFWKVIFPFHAQAFERTGKNKYIHITCIIFGILLPLVPIITIMVDTTVDLQEQNATSTSHGNSSFLEGLGFGYVRFPPTFCTSTNSDASLYSFFLSSILTVGCGCTLLIIVIRSLHKVYIKRKQSAKPGPQFTFGAAEKKLCIVLCYTVLLYCISNTTYSLQIRTFSDYKNNLERFLFCEQGIQNSSNQCIYSDYDSNGFVFFLFLSWILLTLYPFTNLMYAMNIQELKKLWKKAPW